MKTNEVKIVIIPNCNEIKPVIKWDEDENGVRIPHVTCANCHAKLPDGDPIAQHFIQSALKDERPVNDKKIVRYARA